MIRLLITLLVFCCAHVAHGATRESGERVRETMYEDEYDDEMALLGAAFDYDLAGEDDEYDDDDDEEEVGASFSRLMRSRSKRGRRASRGRGRILRRRPSIARLKRAAYVRALKPAIPGVPEPAARNFPLGFGSFTFVNAGVTAAVLTASPQKPFKGSRLVIDVRRTAGAVAELVTITSLNIGQNNQLVSAAALPAEAFSPNSFQTVLSLDPATPGIDVVLGLAISAAPGVAETVTVSAMIIGDTIS